MKNHSGTKGPNASDEAHVPSTRKPAARLRFIEARYATTEKRWGTLHRAPVSLFPHFRPASGSGKLGDLAKRSRSAAPVRRGRANSIQPSTP